LQQHIRRMVLPDNRWACHISMIVNHVAPSITAGMQQWKQQLSLQTSHSYIIYWCLPVKQA